jgi:hypothetical protein
MFASDAFREMWAPRLLGLVRVLLGLIYLEHGANAPRATAARRPISEAGRQGAKGLTAFRFAHYTSAAAALDIINSKRIWMRNTSCMADYSEVQHGYALLNKFVVDENRWGAFASVLYECAPGAAKKALDKFVPWTHAHYPQAIQYNSYITSVSEHDEKEDFHGRLSMWRGFGTGTRVAIVLKLPFFTGAAETLNLMFSPVAYLDEAKVLGVVDEIIQNVRDSKDFLATLSAEEIEGMVFRTLLAGVTCLKHEGFGEELEWRAVYTPEMYRSPLMQGSTKVIGGVPQLVYELPFDKTVSPAISSLDAAEVFDRIIIGPSAYPLAIAKAFSEALTRAGIPAASQVIVPSQIPIRSY